MNGSAEPRRRWTVSPLLILVLLCGTALRCYRLGADSLWIDEFATLRVASLPLPRILSENIGNKSFEPPLYFWLMHGVVQAFGSSETVMRLPSAMAGAVTIPVFWLLARELTGSLGIALLSAALLAFNPLHLWYSQEARPYALLTLFTCLGTIFLAHALRRRSRGAWIGFAGCTLVAVFSHLVGLLLLVVAWVWAFMHVRRRQLVVPLAATSVIVLACVAPLALAIARDSAGPGSGSPPRAASGLDIPYTLFTYVGGYSFGPSLREIQNEGAGSVRAHPVESVMVTVVIALLVGLTVLGRPPSPLGFTLLFLLYVGLTYLASLVTGKAYSIRYTIPALIGFLGIVAAALYRSPPPLRRAGIALLLGLFVWADAQRFFSANYQKDDSRAVVGWLSDRLPKGSVVLVAPGYVTGVLSYYAQLHSADLHFLPGDLAAGPGRPAALVLTRLHHVSDLQSVMARFRRAAGPDASEKSVGGYLVVTAASAVTRPVEQ